MSLSVQQSLLGTEIYLNGRIKLKINEHAHLNDNMQSPKMWDSKTLDRQEPLPTIGRPFKKENMLASLSSM